MKNKDYTELFNYWQGYIDEAFQVSNIQNYKDKEDFGFKEDENYENVSGVNAGKDFIDDFDENKDQEKILKFNKNDEQFGVNQKIMSIIKKLENIVEEERQESGNKSLRGKIRLYEDEYECFIKYDFSNFSPKRQIESTIEFEPTDKDWPVGYGLGAYRTMLTHKSTRGFNALLFELALEFVSIVRDKSLCSDRNSITLEAQPKWHIYANRSDTELLQLDINKEEAEKYGLDQLTPDVLDDDASQEVSVRHKGENWMNSIFSKALKRKDMNTLKYICNQSEHLELVASITNESELLSKL